MVSFRRLRAGAIALLLASGMGATLLTPVLAQQYVPPDRGAPGRREGGGTRGGCLRSQPSLLALVPNQNFGTTISPYPTFFWYLPSTSAQMAEFTLKQEDGSEIYRTTFQLGKQAGIVSLSLPAHAGLPPLEVGKDYRWSFSIICDATDRSGDLFTEGVIQRVQPSTDLVNRLKAAKPEDRPALYAQAGVWYDAIDSLAELRYAQPNSPALLNQWRNLLGSVGLTELANQPLL